MFDNLQPAHGISTFSGCSARLFWMRAGNGALVLLAVFIAQNETLALTAYDLGLWALATAMVAVRYIDISRLRGQTTEGEPATLARWRRHALGLAGVTALLWIAGHVAAATWLVK